MPVYKSQLQMLRENAGWQAGPMMREHWGGNPRGWCLQTQADRIIGQDAAQAVMCFRAGLQTTYSAL